MSSNSSGNGDRSGDSQSLWRRLFRYLRPYWYWAILSLVLTLLVTALSLFPPKLM
jgi:ABC-type multidrug transport system fused ATPase/permease subunit